MRAHPVDSEFKAPVWFPLCDPYVVGVVVDLTVFYCVEAPKRYALAFI